MWYRLNEAVNAWWRCYPDCRIPVNMKLPVLAEEVKANVHGVRVISCSPGTVLLSCGLHNVDTTGHWDVDRYSHIIQRAVSPVQLLGLKLLNPVTSLLSYPLFTASPARNWRKYVQLS